MRAMKEQRRPLTEREENARLVLRTVTHMLNVSDRELSERITASGRAISRAAIQQRRNGDKPLDFRDIEECATALGVPEFLFEQAPIEAAKWLVNSADSLGVRVFGWFSRAQLVA